MQVKQGVINGHPLIDARRLIRADSNFLDLIRLFPTAFLTSNPYPYNVMCAVMQSVIHIKESLQWNTKNAVLSLSGQWNFLSD